MKVTNSKLQVQIIVRHFASGRFLIHDNRGFKNDNLFWGCDVSLQRLLVVFFFSNGEIRATNLRLALKVIVYGKLRGSAEKKNATK